MVPEYEIDLTEPPFVSQIHDTVWALSLVATSVPVQSAPLYHFTVADIAGEAETRRAVVMKANLSCIMTGELGSFWKRDKKNEDELKIIQRDDEEEAWREKSRC